MPLISPYYEELVLHFNVLSRSRSHTCVIYTNKNGVVCSYLIPNPIDIQNILLYNEKIYKILSPSDFLEVMQMLDMMFVSKESKRNT